MFLFWNDEISIPRSMTHKPNILNPTGLIFVFFAFSDQMKQNKPLTGLTLTGSPSLVTQPGSFNVVICSCALAPEMAMQHV